MRARFACNLDCFPRVSLSFFSGFSFETALVYTTLPDRSVDPSPEMLLPLLHANVYCSFTSTNHFATTTVFLHFRFPARSLGMNAHQRRSARPKERATARPSPKQDKTKTSIIKVSLVRSLSIPTDQTTNHPTQTSPTELLG